jgi:hypothetical protein
MAGTRVERAGCTEIVISNHKCGGCAHAQPSLPHPSCVLEYMDGKLDEGFTCDFDLSCPKQAHVGFLVQSRLRWSRGGLLFISVTPTSIQQVSQVAPQGNNATGNGRHSESTQNSFPHRMPTRQTRKFLALHHSQAQCSQSSR